MTTLAVSAIAPVHIARIESLVYRAPSEVPVRTSFGVMKDRPAVFVRVTDSDGVAGWGEIWCNFPAVGAEHRARLLASLIAPLIEHTTIADPAQAWRRLTEHTAVLAIQTGEYGPIAQVIAGVDLALWDLVARRAQLPLFRLLGGRHGTVPAYASGINPQGCTDTAARARDEGFRAFKLKIGFDAAGDVDNVRSLRELLGDHTPLMVDANQAWSPAQALRQCAALDGYGLQWIEEPLRADSAVEDWKRLASMVRTPLAAGENLPSDRQLDEAMGSRAVRVLQPDAAKWGGISALLPAARRIRAAGLRYCPHYLGAGIGLAASAHLLAAAGGDGMLEIDFNPNPLRTVTAGSLLSLQDGAVMLSEAPGIGIEPDLAALAAWRCA